MPLAPFRPKMSMRICTTGWPTSELTVPSKFWIENSSERMRKKPKIEDTPTERSTPLGAEVSAFVVSSDWAMAQVAKTVQEQGALSVSSVAETTKLSRSEVATYHVCGCVESGDGVLGHEHSDDADVRGRRALGPPDRVHVADRDPGAVVKGREHELGRLMHGRFREDGDGKGEDTERVQDDGRWEDQDRRVNSGRSVPTFAGEAGKTEERAY